MQRTELIESRRLLRRPVVARAREVNVRSLEIDLRDAVRGEVRFDAGSRAMYALDASNYRHVPTAVVVPKTRADVIATVGVCREHGVPITSRVGGTGLAGQTTNIGVVIDFSKHLRHILELDAIGQTALVEPGVICDQLAKAAAPFDLTFGPRPATHDRCGFGGMLGNNSCGAYAQMAGKVVDNTEEMDVLLHDGTVMHVGWMTDEELRAAGRRNGREGEIYRGLVSLRDRWGDEIRARFPKLPRRVSGYNLDELLPDARGRVNVARMLVGSESTLVTILGARVRLVWNHPKRVLVVLGYEDIYRAADHVMEVLPHGPIALEGFDEVLHRNIEVKDGSIKDYMNELMPRGRAWLFVELGEATKEEARERAERMVEQLRRGHAAPVDYVILDDEDKRKHMWKVREGALGAESFVPGKPDAWPGWEDSAVRPDVLGGYLRDLRALFDRYGYHPALYGHFGMGCVHCTVGFDLYTAAGVAKYRAFAQDAAHLVTRYGGSLSGEHGDGQARGELLPIMFGPELVDAFRELKGLFDPEGMMNPGRVVDPRPLDADLRLGPSYHPAQPETHFKYPDDHGSMAHATLRCIGIGKCRRTSADSPEADVMCPSFMVTREEKHTTRGRAHLLHEMLTGNSTIDGGWRDENVKEALDLCLSCKGCKGDCPVNVDLATYKAEFLAHYHEGRLRPRAAYAFGLIDQWARVASVAPGLVNLVTQTPGLSAIAKTAAGMSLDRQVPAFAPTTFRSWFRRRGEQNAGERDVVLWADTFSNYFHPEVAQAAVRVLEAAGWHVVVPEGHLCCGRPLYDYGFLTTAKQYLEKVLAATAPHVARGMPIVVLEPSCASVFRDELRGLFPDRADAKRFAEHVKLLSELLAGDHAWTPPRLERKAIVQGHCHHKSVLRFDDEKKLLDAMGLEHEELASGCCGMAGSFGFETGQKHDVSVAAGERVLLPKVREAEPTTLVVADGFSCRTQIEQGTGRGALHLAEVLAMALDEGPDGPGGHEPPEARLMKARTRRVRRSMIRAGVAVGLGAAGIVGVGLAAWMRARAH
ncbi:MAG TPA: FAD-binding and (Fe-S)-binding domain-containing protein [Polyangiaceae bacterium]